MFNFFKNKRNQKILTGAALLLGATIGGSYYYTVTNHPLIKYSRSILESNPSIMNELGSRGRIGFFVHSIKNPEDNEYGYAYKLAGKTGYLRVTVIGDSLKHSVLTQINKEKAIIFDKYENDMTKITEAAQKKEFLPINISRFCIPEKKYDSTEEIPIMPSENMWRLKELIVDSSRSTTKLVTEDNINDIINSKYEIKTYADAYSKMKGKAKSVSPKIVSEVNLEEKGKKEKESSGMSKATIGALIFIPIAIAVTYYTFTTTLTSSSLYQMALSVLQTSNAAKAHLGEKIMPLWVKGNVYRMINRGSIRIYTYGTNGEGLVKVKGKKPRFGKKKIWQITHFTLYQNGKKIEI